MRTFRTIRRSLAPRWLVEGEGELVGYSLDLLKDAFVERARLGLLARFPTRPDGSTTYPDALAAMGRDRRVVRGLNESDATYAGRLLAWLDDRKVSGNPFALMKKLAEYLGSGVSFRTVDARGNWYSRDASGGTSYALNAANWNWDGASAGVQWARFWVIVYPNGLWTSQPAVGSASAVGAQAGTVGSSAVTDEVRTVRSIVADWKPAGTSCVNIVEALDASSFDPAAPEPDGTWAHWSYLSAGAQVPARLSTARYWDGC